MIKKILLSLFGFITLGLINFSNAFSVSDIPDSAIITTGSVNLEYTNTSVSNQMYNLTISDLNATSDIPFSYYCMYVYNFDSGSLGGSAWITFGFGTINVGNWTVVPRGFSNEYGNSNFFVEPNRFWLDRVSQFNNGGLLCAYNYRRYINLGIAETSVNSRTYIFDYIVFDYNKLSFGSSVDCSQDSNYLQCLEQVSTLSGNLSTCQSDLLNCQNSSSSCDYSEYESIIYTLSGNLAQCESENLTLSGNLTTCEGELNSCMSGISTGDVQWSSLFINNIQHLGASTIYITIPEEISWDYTNENDEFDLNVVGYNVDTEYIEGIINNQSTLPNQVDLNNIIRNVLPLFVPGLVIILFIYFIFRFIKKIF